MQYGHKLAQFCELKDEISGEISRQLQQADDQNKNRYAMLDQIYKRTIAGDCIGAFERFCESPEDGNSLIFARAAYVHMQTLPEKPLGRTHTANEDVSSVVQELKEVLPLIVARINGICSGLPFAREAAPSVKSDGPSIKQLQEITGYQPTKIIPFGRRNG